MHQQWSMTVLPAIEIELLGHAKHVYTLPAPTVVEYVLRPQFMQLLPDDTPVAVEYVPAPQFKHALFEFAPSAGEYLPATQSTQLLAAVAPIVKEYLPALQSVQPEAPFCEYVPAAQVMQTEDEAAEKVPAVQLVHAALPMVFLYEPALHSVQAPPFCPVNPALHEQLLECAAGRTDGVRRTARARRNSCRVFVRACLTQRAHAQTCAAWWSARCSRAARARCSCTAKGVLVLSARTQSTIPGSCFVVSDVALNATVVTSCAW